MPKITTSDSVRADLGGREVPTATRHATATLDAIALKRAADKVQKVASDFRQNDYSPRLRPRPSARWHLDEMAAVVIGVKRLWLWRAVDTEGEERAPSRTAANYPTFSR